jgi:hypothetical protein
MRGPTEQVEAFGVCTGYGGKTANDLRPRHGSAFRHAFLHHRIDQNGFGNGMRLMRPHTMKFYPALLASLAFVAALLCVYYIHSMYFKVDVVLYSAVFDGVLAATLAAAWLFRSILFRCLNSFEKIQLTIIWLLAGYAFAISVPTVIDRSLSFYLLEKLQQRGGGIRLDRFETVFTEEYVKEHRLLDVRLTEQQQSGTIEITDNCVRLTERGRRLARFSRFFRLNLLPKKRLLMGEYSDALTDPFRHQRSGPGYECKPK